MAAGGVEGGSRVELRQVGHDLDGCFSLLAGQGRESIEEVCIRETGRESEQVRIHHESMYHGDFWGRREGRARARSVERSGVAERGPVGARVA